jgi:hypothetical protein
MEREINGYCFLLPPMFLLQTNNVAERKKLTKNPELDQYQIINALSSIHPFIHCLDISSGAKLGCSVDIKLINSASQRSI